MTKTFSITLKTIVVALVLCAVYLSALSVYADVRGSSERGRDTGRVSVPVPAAPAPSSAPSIYFFTQNTGGISSSIGGTADSGGNSGGNVTTGNEEVEVSLVNIGPTNSSDVVLTPNPAEDEGSAPECSERRSANCANDGRGR